MTEPSMDTTKVQFGEPVILLVLLTGVLVKNFLQEQK